MTTLPKINSVSPNKIRLAFLGGAINSAIGRSHRIAVEMDHRFDLSAGCFSRHEDVNMATAREYGVSPDRVYNNLEDLLANEAKKIDAIVILTPIPQHKDQVLACLKAGVPVICEKALAGSSAQADEIEKALKQQNGFLAAIYNYTGYPMLRELRDIVQRGDLGRISQVHIEMHMEGFARLKDDGSPIVPQDWRLHDLSIPMVSLDLGTHTHSIVKFLTNETPIELTAMSDTYGNFEVIDSVHCLARYSNDMTCNMWYGKATLGVRNGLRVRLFGSKGSAEWLQENPEYLQLADIHGRRTILDRAHPDAKISNADRYTRFKAGHPAGFIEAFANYYDDIAEHLLLHLNGEKPHNSYVLGINEAIEGLRMLEAIVTSSSNDCWVEIGSSGTAGQKRQSKSIAV